MCPSCRVIRRLSASQSGALPITRLLASPYQPQSFRENGISGSRPWQHALLYSQSSAFTAPSPQKRFSFFFVHAVVATIRPHAASTPARSATKTVSFIKAANIVDFDIRLRVDRSGCGPHSALPQTTIILLESAETKTVRVFYHAWRRGITAAALKIG